MLRFYMLALFQKDSRIMKWPRQEKLGLELKSLMEEIADTKISLNKLEIRSIVLSDMLKEFVGRTFYKSKT